jgi:hypothetical protein
MRDALERPEQFAGAPKGLVERCRAELVPHREGGERWLLQAQRSSAGRFLAADDHHERLPRLAAAV